MLFCTRGLLAVAVFALACSAAVAQGQLLPERPLATAPHPAPSAILFTVVDENGLSVSGAQILVAEPGQPAVHLITDYDGRASWKPSHAGSFTITISKPGFYQSSQSGLSTSDTEIKAVIPHEQWLKQEVHVTASTPGIDPTVIANKTSMNTEEVVNIPYPVNRDVRQILPFNPGVVADATGQVHVAGGNTWMTLDTLDGFDIRSPITGNLDLRVSPDAVRSIDTETTRYPVQYGRSTGGVIAFSTGMGDNKFRYDATNFIPSFRDQNGIRFDTVEPRFTFSGPIVRNRAWYFNAFDFQYTDSYIVGLPSGADTNPLMRGGELLKFQTNIGSTNSLTSALFFNDYHSPYEGLSVIEPQVSTEKHDIVAWLPYFRDQQSFKNGVMIDSGFGILRYREGWEPHGDTPFVLNPEIATGSNFETMTTSSQRVEGYTNIYLPPRHALGNHQITLGLDLDHIGFTDDTEYAPTNYVREDGTLSRRSTYPTFPIQSRSNLEFGSYIQDRWTPGHGLLVDPGIRYDWDEIVRKPLFSPRIALNYSPPGQSSTTKISAGIGEYYSQTDLEYLNRALSGTRYDTYYAADGVTPLGPPQLTTFTANDDLLHQAHALNWSVGAQRRLPWDIYAGLNFMQERTSGIFVYANQDGTGAQPGNYLLTNGREDHYRSMEVDARKSFHGDYTLFASYTRSSATTNAAIDYSPAIDNLITQLNGLPAIIGPQQPGPLPWDTPNRVISWGWLPAWAPSFPSVRKNWDFVYTALWYTGFPFDSVDANNEIVGPAGSHRFPDFLSFSPGLEWRFHFGGKYFGLRGMIENATGRMDPYIVNDNVDSPQYLTFSQPLGRAFTARIRLIQSSQ